MRGLLALLATTLILGGAQGDDPPAFKTPPRVARAPNGAAWTVSFEVRRATDVAVAVADAKGHVVRHLAAGVLGPNAPEPLAKGTLAQTLTWDGRDDWGGPAKGGPFTVRVGLGLTTAPAGSIFDDPNRLSGVSGMVVGPKGNLHLICNWKDGGWGGGSVRVFSRRGRHLRTIAPMPAGLAAERVKPLGAIATEDGGYIPRVYNLRRYSFYPINVTGSPPGVQQPVIDGAGRLFTVSTAGAGPVVCVLSADGGVSAGWSFAGAGLFSKGKAPSAARVYLALSSDGKRLCASGFGGSREGKSLPVVYATDVKARGEAAVLVDGRAAKDESGQAALTDARGIACDGRGHLLVADRSAGRIVVFKEADGSYVRGWPVKGVDQLAVSRATGAVYAQTIIGPGEKGGNNGELIKFADVTGRNEAARMRLPTSSGRRRCLMALDDTGDRPLVWVAVNGWKHADILRIEDLGDRFGEAVNIGGKPEDNQVEDVFVDRRRNEVYVYRRRYYWRFPDGSTAPKQVPVSVWGNSGSQLQAGPSGDLYGYAWRNRLWKFGRDGEEKTFAANGKHELPMSSTMTYQMRGLFCDPRTEDLYILQPPRLRRGGKPSHVLNVYDKEGRFKRTVVHRVSDGAVGPRVDLKGNVYIGVCARPGSPQLPAFFRARVGEIKGLRTTAATYPYSWGTGSIVKFAPEGGQVLWPGNDKLGGYTTWPKASKDTAGPAFYGHQVGNKMIELASHGVLWAHAGFAPAVVGAGAKCNCLAAYFDVDLYGRVFYPEAFRFRVGVLDTNGAPIAHVGRYGTRDEPVAGDTVPLTFPIAVAATDDHLYIADIQAQRLVRVKLEYRVSAQVNMN